MKNVHLKLPDDLHRRLKSRAALDDKTVVEAGIEAVKLYINLLPFSSEPEPIRQAPEQALQDKEDLK